MFLILACVNNPTLERDMQSTEQSRPIPFLLFNEQKGVKEHSADEILASAKLIFRGSGIRVSNPF